MIGTLMYLTSSRPDIVFVVCMCARYQAKPIEKHLHKVKQIFQYLKGTINMGLWYLKDSCLALTSFADVDHAGCQDTRKSTSRSMQLLGDRLKRVSIGRHLHQAFSMRTIRISHQKAWNAKHVPGDSEKAVRQRGRVILVKDSEFYEFLLANKNCIIDAEVFRKILDICPRVEGEEFTPVQDDDTLTFRTDLGYKESYQMFIKYSTGQISPKKIRGRGSLGKKTINVSQETVDVSEESEPEPAKKRTAKTQQVAARDEKWVPSSERVKISSTNVRLETTMPQKEEKFQVVINIIKNSTCFKSFTIFADVLEIFMQQF
nr:uncharacterized mitochondrial protein AtMg00810-like [Tanacetum cinerariifolium]